MKKIFISHITEEKEIAKLIKQGLENLIFEEIQVFVSSDPSSIQIGDTWLEKINKNLNFMDCMIVICSPNSYKRPWINFESGYALGKGVPCILICIGTLTPEMLGLPLNQIQVLTMGAYGFEFEKLMNALNCRLNLTSRSKIENIVMWDDNLKTKITTHFVLSILDDAILELIKVAMESKVLNTLISIFENIEFEKMNPPKIIMPLKEFMIPNLKKKFNRVEIFPFINFEEKEESSMSQHGTCKTCIITLTKAGYDRIKMILELLSSKKGES